MEDRFLWKDKYAPTSLEETILPSDLKETFKGFIKKGNLPDFLFIGPKGIGKTSVAKILVKAIGCEHYYINASLHGNVDTIRNDIAQFASTMSMVGEGKKYVILDEADGTSEQFQKGLRAFMETYSDNCGFILTANFGTKIMEPIWSRCSVVEFRIPPSEQDKLKGRFFKKLVYILENEKVKYDELVLLELIDTHFPDWRRIINELQRYSVNGVIDTGILASVTAASLETLLGFMKGKDFTNVRKWVEENSDTDPNILFKMFYDQANDLFKVSSIPELVVTLAEYQYKATRVANQAINTSACFLNIMANCEWR